MLSAVANAARQMLPGRVGGRVGGVRARRRPPPSRAIATPAASAPSLPPAPHRAGSLAAAAVVGAPRATAPRSFAAAAAAAAGGPSDAEYQARLGAFQDLFAEARLSLEDARDSAGTTYFEEDLDQSIEDVDRAIGAFEGLAADLDERRRGELMRSQGLKVEQLKGELQLIKG